MYELSESTPGASAPNTEIGLPVTGIRFIHGDTSKQYMLIASCM